MIFGNFNPRYRVSTAKRYQELKKVEDAELRAKRVRAGWWDKPEKPPEPKRHRKAP